MKNSILLPILFSTIGLFSLNAQNNNKIIEEIILQMLEQQDGYFYLDTMNYPVNRNELPIGIFDSGTGGLTVFKSILKLDSFNNESHKYGKDGLNDFVGEQFIYLGDRANMPYGNYNNENKADLLQEHIIKDVQFLLSEKYYSSAQAVNFETDKLPVKSIIIACNTASAYGVNDIELLMDLSGLSIKVIGVIDAGARGAINALANDQDGIIGVLATEGTVSSMGYEKALLDLIQTQDEKANIEVFSQGGVGIAESLDGDSDYYNRQATQPYTEYKGPGFRKDKGIDNSLLYVYRFDFSDGKMLCDNEDLSDCSIMQINDPVNYMRFHLVSLMEKIRSSNTQEKLKVLILGCTHYPFLIEEIYQILKELYDFKSSNEEYRYRPYMANNIKLIDPSQNTALELYEHLKDDYLFSVKKKLSESTLYISVPNEDNENIVIDTVGRFTYDYKYGRTAGNLQEYVKRIPLTKETIDKNTLQRIKEQMPFIYSLIGK